MNRCIACEGFVPHDAKECPNCKSTRRAWWMAPLALAGAGVASITLSACYGLPCTGAATQVTLLDGGTESVSTCINPDGGTFDCRRPLPDGGSPLDDPDWETICGGPIGSTDGGADGG